jgi:hypothetical protein
MYKVASEYKAAIVSTMAVVVTVLVVESIR